jgi:hypothetical protein
MLPAMPGGRSDKLRIGAYEARHEDALFAAYAEAIEDGAGFYYLRPNFGGRAADIANAGIWCLRGCAVAGSAVPCCSTRSRRGGGSASAR